MPTPPFPRSETFFSTSCCCRAVPASQEPERADPRVDAVVRSHAAAGKWLAAICAAPTVLHAAGLLDGRRYTAHFSVAGELPDILTDQRVVVDGNILTSRGAGTALDFGLLLVGKNWCRLKKPAISRARSARNSFQRTLKTESKA